MRASIDHEKCAFRVLGKSKKMPVVESQSLLDGRSRTIAATDPQHLGRMAEQETSLMKVRVFADEGEASLGGIVPDRLVGGFAEADVAYVAGPRILLSKRPHEPVRKILIEEQFHCEGSEKVSVLDRRRMQDKHGCLPE